MDRRERLKLRESRSERQRRIWLILRYLVTYDSLSNSQDFYEFRENHSAYQQALEALRGEKPSRLEFDTAFRFCSLKFRKGECERNISSEEKQIALNWESNSINLPIILENVLESYKAYWGDMLTSYKKPSARINRLNYLVEKLEEFKTWPEIATVPDLVYKIEQLQVYFSNILKKEGINQ